MIWKSYKNFIWLGYCIAPYKFFFFPAKKYLCICILIQKKGCSRYWSEPLWQSISDALTLYVGDKKHFSWIWNEHCVTMKNVEIEANAKCTCRKFLYFALASMQKVDIYFFCTLHRYDQSQHKMQKCRKKFHKCMWFYVFPSARYIFCHFVCLSIHIRQINVLWTIPTITSWHKNKCYKDDIQSSIYFTQMSKT